jgi:hypothetical protein
LSNRRPASTSKNKVVDDVPTMPRLNISRHSNPPITALTE